MRKIYDRIVDLRGNLITVIAENVGLGELAGYSKVTALLLTPRFSVSTMTWLLCRYSRIARGISTGDRVTFLGHPMQAVFSDALLGRRLNGAGTPIDDGPEVFGSASISASLLLIRRAELFRERWYARISR